jgi:hypothetical protein
MKVLRAIYFISISVIIGWTFTGLLLCVLPIGFTDGEIEFEYYKISFFGVPLSLLFTLTGTIKPQDSALIIGGKILQTIVASVVSGFFVFIIAWASTTCRWTSGDVFFQNRNNPHVKIVERNFGCGATDTSRPVIEIFKVRELTEGVIWVTEIDTSMIDKAEWVRVSGM